VGGSPRRAGGSDAERGDTTGWAARLAGKIRSFARELVESDEAHLAHELRSWAASIPGTTLIADAPLRHRVRLAGEVSRVTIRPGEPFDEIETTLYDGSGELRVVWFGRRSIPGLTLGSRLVVEGTIGEMGGERRMIDPVFEFVPLDRH
jgi:hypothetical protein